MTEAKELFQRQKELCDKFKAVVNQEWFLTALTYVDAELMTVAEPADIRGARLYKLLLLGLSQDEEPGPKPHPALLHHTNPKPTGQKEKD